jgi:tRNA 2-thiouridine synthesizing protein D
MNLGLHVLSPPTGSLATRSAVAFAMAAIGSGHQVSRVFFSGDGVLNGTSLRLAASNEFDACSEWQALWRAHGTELVLCVSACHQRGILGAEEAARHGRTGASLAEGFIVAGLGQLAELTAVADRVVTFG